MDVHADFERQRFENIVRDLEVDERLRLHDLERMAPPNRTYIILFSARSGSTWLTSILSATQRLGTPDEYINPDFVQGVAKATNATTQEHLLAGVMRRRKTRNLVFGMEARHVDIDLFGFEPFRRVFGAGTIYFHLWRDNLVAQGISLYKAIVTQIYHSNSGCKKTIPPYDADGILRWVRHIANTENGNVQMLRRLNVPARHLIYEDIIKDRKKTIELFAHAMAVPFTPDEFSTPGQDELSRLADDWNVEAEARLRRERPQEIEYFEKNRLVKIGISPSRHPPPPEDAESLELWQRGHRSGAAGRSPLNNPFPKLSAEAVHWARGWERGWDSQPYHE